MDTQTTKRYNYWQWRTLITLMIGYALYYFVRKHFSIVMPAMEETLGISKVQLGLFLTLNGIIYGLSRFVNGFLADRFNRRKLMTAGLILSALANLAICFSPSMNSFMNVLDTDGKATMALVYIIGSLWVLNGYFQGMGVPPCISLMCHWIRPEELATKQSIWNASHSIGAGLISLLCGFLLKHYGYSAWQLCFAIPAAIAIIGAIALFFTLKDTPSSVGLPEIEEIEKEEKGESTQQNIQKQILKVQKLHHQLDNIRTDYIDKCIWDIVKTKPSYIVIEDLNVSGMMKSRHLSKAVAAQKFYEFRVKLTTKCKEYGIELRIVDRFYPSSKTCHHCGAIKKDLKLSDRTYKCTCGYEADRDFNASLNLRDAKTYKLA